MKLVFVSLQYSGLAKNDFTLYHELERKIETKFNVKPQYLGYHFGSVHQVLSFLLQDDEYNTLKFNTYSCTMNVLIYTINVIFFKPKHIPADINKRLIEDTLQTHPHLKFIDLD